MAKKKETPKEVEKIGIKRIDYLTLIESLSVSAFEYYVDKIIDDLNFKILKRDDIRKIDIEEKVLYRIEFLYYRSLRLKDDESVERYVSFLKQYLEGFIGCEDNSRASAYFDRAIGLADRLCEMEGSEEDLHDLVLLFIGLFKAFKAADMQEITDIDLIINKDDDKLIRWISEGEDIKVPAKGRFKVAKNPVKELSDFDKEFLFFTTLLYSCILMQENGEFGEDF